MYQYLGEDNYNNNNSNYNTNSCNNNEYNKKVFYGYKTKNNNKSSNGLNHSIDNKSESNNIIEYDIVRNINNCGYKDLKIFNSSIKKNYINQTVYNTLNIENNQNIGIERNEIHKKSKKNKFREKNLEDIKNENNMDCTNFTNNIGKMHSTSSFGIEVEVNGNVDVDDNDVGDEEEFQYDIIQAEVLQNQDHNELITPTYISMFFNATSMISLYNVNKMIKNEPIEVINESYDTCNTNDTKYNPAKCIPIIDLYSLVSDIP